MACHHARFMAKAIYYLTLDLLHPQFQTLAPDLVSAMEVVVIRQKAEFILIFYTTLFIKAPLAGTAPSQDLQSIDGIIQYILGALVLLRCALIQCRIISGISLNDFLYYVSLMMTYWKMFDKLLLFSFLKLVVQRCHIHTN